MKVQGPLSTAVDRFLTTAGYRLPMDNVPFSARRAADEIEAEAAVRGDLDDETVRALAAHFRHLDEAVLCIPSVVRKDKTPAYIAHRVRQLRILNR